MPLWRKLTPALLLGGLLVLLAAVLLYPIWLTIRGGFQGRGGGLTLYHLQQVFTEPGLRAGLLHAFGIAACVTLVSTLIALPLAVLTTAFDFPCKRIFGSLILVPMILPPFVGAIGLHFLLGRSGAINALLMRMGLIETGIDFIGRGGLWAIVIVESLALYPIMYLNAVAALANLDPALDEAAENLGAGWWRRFRQITLPLIRPGLFAGGTIVFIWSFTELGTPLMFDYQVITPVQIFNGIKEMETSKTPYALTAVMLLSAIMLYVVGKWLLGGRAYAMYAKASIQASSTPLRGWRAACAACLFALVIAIAILPHLSVILVSFASDGAWYRSILPRSFTLQHYADALSHPLAVGAIRNSLLYASVAVVIDLLLGLMIGYLIVRTRLWGRSLLDALAMLPLAVPGLVMAFGYVAMTLRWPFGKGDPLHGVIDVIGAEPNPIPLLIIAFAVRRLPYVVRSTVAGLQQTSVEMEEAAMNLGAGRLRAIRTVVVPLISANLIAGGLLAFSFAMLEVSDSLILAQREQHFPITKAIYVLFERLGNGMSIASAMGVWAMALLAATLIGASAMMGRKLGAIFRVERAGTSSRRTAFAYRERMDCTRLHEASSHTWQRGEYTISTDRSRLDIDVIHQFLTTCYWSPGIPRDIVERAIAHAECFGIFHRDTAQVGFARVVTDYTTFAWLADVFVLEAHRGKGLSKWLVECILSHPDLQGFRRWVLATRDAHGLYAQFDFTPLSDATRWMEKWRPDVYRKRPA